MLAGSSTRETSLSGKYFPSEAVLAKRLNVRFGGVSSDQGVRAKDILTRALGASWGSPADLDNRRRDVLEALAHLDFGGAERKVSYLQRAVDLQLTKAAGILMYSALVAAVVGILLARAGQSELQVSLLVLSGLLLVVAAVLTISTSMTHWPSENDFQSAEDEAKWLIRLLVKRGRRTNVAVPLAIIATVLVPIGIFGPRALEIAVGFVRLALE